MEKHEQIKAIKGFIDEMGSFDSTKMSSSKIEETRRSLISKAKKLPTGLIVDVDKLGLTYLKKEDNISELHKTALDSLNDWIRNT